MPIQSWGVLSPWGPSSGSRDYEISSNFSSTHPLRRKEQDPLHQNGSGETAQGGQPGLLLNYQWVYMYIHE